MEAPVNTEKVLDIVRKHEDGWGGMIAVLTDIQYVFGYLPEEALRIVASATDTSLADIYGVATFYRAFSLHPRGKHHICVCLGTACHVRGAQMVVEEFERQLNIRPGETTLDGNFSLETVNCLGACALGPIVTMDNDPSTKVRPADIRKILKTSWKTDTEATDSLGVTVATALGQDMEEATTI